MTTWWQALILGILQGTTEFLPVSSSGHLVIVPHLLGWASPGLAVDTLLHLGTLAAILIYFRDDLWRLVRASLRAVRYRHLNDAEARLALYLILGTVPAALLGLIFEDAVEQLFGMPRAAAAFLLGTATLLLLSEALGRRTRSLEAMRWWEAGLIGLSQALAMAPGLSRSGATIAAGLLLGYRREDAARFSFLLAIPIIGGSGLYQLLKLMRYGPTAAPPGSIVVGFAAAAVTGYIAIAALLAVVRRWSLLPFALYCALLGFSVLFGVWG